MRRKLLFVEDHALVRESLLLLLEARLPGLALRQAGTLAGALRLLADEPDIDLLLLDLDLPDSRGLATLKRAREAAPMTPVVVLSASDEQENVLAAIDLGAAGFLSKTVDAQALVKAVQRLVAGGVVVPADAGASPVWAQPRALPELTERQRDVLRLLIDGKPNKLICRELDLSEATVKTHLQAVFRRLDVNTRTQAVLAAARLGLTL